MICVEQLPRFSTSIGEIAEAQADAASVFERSSPRLRSLREPKWSRSNRIFSLGIPCRASSNSGGAADMISWS
jgi:hypothetical protein